MCSHQLRVEIDHHLPLAELICRLCSLPEVEIKEHFMTQSPDFAKILSTFFKHFNQQCLALKIRDTFSLRLCLLQSNSRAVTHNSSSFLQIQDNGVLKFFMKLGWIMKEQSIIAPRPTPPMLQTMPRWGNLWETKPIKSIIIVECLLREELLISPHLARVLQSYMWRVVLLLLSPPPQRVINTSLMLARVTQHNPIHPDIFLEEIIQRTHGVNVHCIKLDDENDCLPPLVILAP